MARERVEIQRSSSGRFQWTRWIGDALVRRSLHTYTTRAKAMKAGREKPKLPPVGVQDNRVLWLEYQEVVG